MDSLWDRSLWRSLIIPIAAAVSGYLLSNAIDYVFGNNGKISGFVFGAFVALAASLFHSSDLGQRLFVRLKLKGRKDIENFLGANVLAILPDHEEGYFVPSRSTKSLMYGACQILANRLDSSGINRSMMITSAVPAEGKSTVTLMLGILEANRGKRVLLIDADMRRPSLHGHLCLSNNVGLSNYLVGDNDWKRMVTNTPFHGLDLIKAGPMPPDPTGILRTDRFSILISSALEFYDLVFIDVPPVCVSADPSLIGRICSSILMISAFERVKPEITKEAVQLLKDANCAPVVVALNRIARGRYGTIDALWGGFYYGYGYQYAGNDDTASEGEGRKDPSGMPIRDIDSHFSVVSQRKQRVRWLYRGAALASLIVAIGLTWWMNQPRSLANLAGVGSINAVSFQGGVARISIFVPEPGNPQLISDQIFSSAQLLQISLKEGLLSNPDFSKVELNVRAKEWKGKKAFRDRLGNKVFPLAAIITFSKGDLEAANLPALKADGLLKLAEKAEFR
jgi:capsular exopolysaccharide synthesis family protein